MGGVLVNMGTDVVTYGVFHLRRHGPARRETHNDVIEGTTRTILHADT
jgi:hypothetical protein